MQYQPDHEPRPRERINTVLQRHYPNDRRQRLLAIVCRQKPESDRLNGCHQAEMRGGKPGHV
jgi:hypothetical protein